MRTTVPEIKPNSNCQEMGETREPMAYDCWQDAHRLAHLYNRVLQRDFWVLFAAKPHVKNRNSIVMGWDVTVKRPPQAMVGVMVFKWSYKDQCLTVEADLSLPYDVPLSDEELSRNDKDFVPSVARAAEKSGSILLA
jgi:hypothetical protein